MDLSMLIIGAGLVAGSLILSITIEHLMRRFEVQPVQPEERSGGIRDVFNQLSEWRRRAEVNRKSGK